ncbi:ABC transporter substrate-binding protein [Brachybacterium sp. YJGR34]|uniref:ABC transporter substrate-binding protein n=1 Tax=Brachybacterium sp. YJGR34 TaxID=2059911 RepID=UPI000E0ABBCB|nr:extracellular solute-binding protein [Brachybacterium sp. YJGR34]
MATIDRRRLLALAVLAPTTAATAAACSRSSAPETGGGDSGTAGVTWWDHFDPLENALTGLFDAFAAEGGAAVERTVYNPNDMGQALQLAQTSSQLPDVFTNLFGVPSTSLVADGTVGPVELDDEAQQAVADVLFEGIHLFDGKVHSVPIFSHQQHSTLTWMNREMVEAAGHDPDVRALSWDEFRSLCADLASSGTALPWVTNLAFSDRMGEHLTDLAQAAGQALVYSAGISGATDPATGDYVFHADAFVDSLEFLKSLISDGYMLPASTSLDAREARVRWASGDAAIFLDGPWNAGVVAGQFEDFLPNLAVANLPSPDGEGVTARGPAEGQFWWNAASDQADAVGELFSLLTRPDFSAALAANMDQPPADLDAVSSADVADSYATAIDIFRENCFLAPSPVARNAAVGTVIARMDEVRPNLGEIAQGYLGGDLDDARSALKTYSDALTEERQNAIDAVAAEGTEVSLADWVFEDYRLGDDYDATKY